MKLEEMTVSGPLHDCYCCNAPADPKVHATTPSGERVHVCRRCAQLLQGLLHLEAQKRKAEPEEQP
jgi:hypothetical protein